MASTLIALALLAADLQHPDQPSTSAAMFRAESRLVLVSYSVTRQKKFVVNLTRDQFAITEDGVEQEIAVFDGPRMSDPERLPVELILLVDVSGSTVFNGLLTPAVVESITSRIGNRAGIAVYSFAKRCVRVCGPTRDPRVLSFALARAFEQPHDGTYLYEAVAQVAADVTAALRPSLRTMVILSDANQQGSATADSAVAAATRAGIRLFPILMRQHRIRQTEDLPELTAGGDWQDQQYLQMGERTGGMGMEPNQYLSPQGMAKLLDSIVARFATEYTVGYYRKNTQAPRRSRKVKVHLRNRALGKVQGGERTLPNIAAIDLNREASSR